MLLVRLFIPAISFSLLLGIGVAFFVPISQSVITGGILVCIIVAVVLRKQPVAVLIALCVIVGLLGVMRSLGSVHTGPSPLEDIYNSSVIVSGEVVGDIEHSSRSNRFTVLVETINGEELKEKVHIIVFEQFPTNCVSGEHVIEEVRIQKPENFLTETGRIFNYEKYLRIHNTYGIASIRDSACVGYTPEYNVFTTIRNTFVKTIATILPTEQAALLGGLLLGIRGGFPKELLEAFRITGLIHIVVLSGYNITIVAESIRRMLVRLPRTVSTIIASICIVLFVVVSGGQIAAVRAAGMGIIALIARATYREYDGIRALFLVAAVLALVNPAIVIFSTSFHLSFLATFGLMTLTPFFEKLFHRITERFQLRSIIAVTTATQIFLVPYLALAIGEVSVIGFIANILVLPLIPLIMLFGVVIALVTIVVPPLGTALAPLVYIPLTYTIGLTYTLSEVPYASVPLPQVPALALLVFYTACCTYLIHHTIKQGRKRNTEKSKEREDKEKEVFPTRWW